MRQRNYAVTSSTAESLPLKISRALKHKNQGQSPWAAVLQLPFELRRFVSVCRKQKHTNSCNQTKRVDNLGLDYLRVYLSAY